MSDSQIDEAQKILDSLHAHVKQFIFFPVNDSEIFVADSGCHWSLLLYSRIENTFYGFDSMRNANGNAVKKIIQVLKRALLNCEAAKYKYHPSVQQKNSSDCGIYVICNAENIANHILCSGAGVIWGVNNLNEDYVRGKRDEILKIIRACADA
jgi:sentrin-specific protease 8